MKKIFILSLAAFVVVLSGCGTKPASPAQEKNSRIIWHSEVQGDEIYDAREPATVCGQLQTDKNLTACALLESKRSDDPAECADGQSVAGCFACKFGCPAETAKEASFAPKINASLKNGAEITEVANPGITLPAGIDPGQIKKYFRLDSVLFALVMRNSMNVVLNLPENFAPSFAGVLIANEGDKQWTKSAEVKDATDTDKNNPYYLISENGKLLLTVVDQNGAGSGEGKMKIFSLDNSGKWNLEKCYYFGGGYSSPETDGDYFEYSVKFEEQDSEPIESCNNALIITAN